MNNKFKINLRSPLTVICIVLALLALTAGAVLGVNHIKESQRLNQYQNLLTRGANYLEIEDYRKGVTSYQEAVRLIPDLADAYIKMAEVDAGSGDYEAAYYVLDQAEQAVKEAEKEKIQKEREYLLSITRVVGMITSEDGTELQDVEVQLCDSKGETIGETLSNRIGRYAFDLRKSVSGNYEIRVDMEQYQKKSMEVDLTAGENKPETLVLITNTIIRGFVQDDYDNPMSGAVVQVFDAMDQYIAAGFSDDEGQYSINLNKNITGAYKLTISQESYQPKNVDISLFSGENEINTVRLKLITILNGLITDQNGSPLEGALVTVDDHEGNRIAEAMTDVSGNVSIDTGRSLTGSCLVTVSLEGYKTKSFEQPVDAGTVEFGSIAIEKETTLINGAVVNSAGSGLSGVTVQLIDSKGNTAGSVTTDGGGGFSFYYESKVRGKFTLVFTLSGYDKKSLSISVDNETNNVGAVQMSRTIIKYPTDSMKYIISYLACYLFEEEGMTGTVSTNSITPSSDAEAFWRIMRIAAASGSKSFWDIVEDRMTVPYKTVRKLGYALSPSYDGSISGLSESRDKGELNEDDEEVMFEKLSLSLKKKTVEKTAFHEDGSVDMRVTVQFSGGDEMEVVAHLVPNANRSSDSDYYYTVSTITLE